MLQLVNRDRAEEGLDPVEWDETAAKAAKRHAEDMARHGFTGHWGSDGSVPEERYTDVGGEHLSEENAGGLADGQERKLDPHQVFDPADLERIEGKFMGEKPPHDGHRKNILAKWHNKVGIAVVKTLDVPNACLVQEFVDDYGDYKDLPRKAKIGQKITVSGEVNAPAHFGGVGIGRIDAPKPIAVEKLLTLTTYPVPDPYVMYMPKEFKTPKPVTVKGNEFTIDVELDDHHRPGRYEVSVWGNYPGSDKNELVMLSLRVIDVH